MSDSPAGGEPIRLGDPVPWFGAPTLAGGSVDLHVQAGRWVVLAFVNDLNEARAAHELSQLMGEAALFDEDKLVVYGADNPVGFELCGAQADSCHYASADIHGNQVVLRAALPVSDIKRVRYCWADSPICTLYDGSGLPAGPFELPITPTLGRL